MIPVRSFAMFLIATCALLTRAEAQNVYRCGDSYSQSPCPGGVAIDASDSRTKGQKAQADADTQRDRQAANALEKERLKQEAAVTPAPPKADAAKTSAAATPHPSRKKKHKEPAYFTARTAADKKADKKKSAAAP